MGSHCQNEPLNKNQVILNLHSSDNTPQAQMVYTVGNMFNTYIYHRLHACFKLFLLSRYTDNTQTMILNMTIITLLLLVYFIISEMI